ncbi:MAG TPA: L-ribulose-5-phosphate 4-epimerase [Bacteroidales bacterium]|jgi:L-ribulose-5-phosphate 4-epimerase|nr:L-ribulose-5-phosphate 4-epimerase [Bacteroidales bacterium]
MLEKLKREVFQANIELVKHGLVIHTWGNVSGKDKETGLIIIKPSGVSYSSLREEDMVVLDSAGNKVEGKYKPSTDAPTHLYLYKAWPSLGGIVHTHSAFATAWAQAGRDIPPLGTTHADHFYGVVPCTRELTADEVEADYELNTGKVIVERLSGLDPLDLPSALVNRHGPFCWGPDAGEAVYNAVALEEIAKMAFYTVLLKKSEPVESYLLNKHFRRKHGKDAYYGQGIKKNK